MILLIGGAIIRKGDNIRGFTIIIFLLVPARPRKLSSSSSEDTSNHMSFAASSYNNATENIDYTLSRISDDEKMTDSGGIITKHNARLLTDTNSYRNDWFSVVGTDEHSSTEKYIQGKVGEDFGHSTDSSSSNDDGILT